jgi:hypothetical protein
MMATTNAMVGIDLMHILLQEFDDVFTMPTGLPPVWHHNHMIHLLPDTRRWLFDPIATRSW